MAGFLALAFAAWETLDGQLLGFTWFILGVCALKTVMVVLRRRLD
jgi:hypothetical protein